MAVDLRWGSAMPKYLVTYHDGGEMPTDPEANAQMMNAFGAWATGVGSALVDPGAPLSHAKTVSATGVKDGQDRAKIGGYTLLEADDLDHAVSLVQGHPFLARGGNLQVSEAVDLH
ncbi:MAG: hypothetical protein WB116_03770 [Candidatus Dormiibacterota bacterium]